MRIVREESIVNQGAYAASRHWKATLEQIRESVQLCEWPAGSGSFTIYPQSGKKSGQGNGVVPIRRAFIADLKRMGWKIEGPAKNALGRQIGDYDAVLAGPENPIVVEWETGNISSSHRSINKIIMQLAAGIISAGVLVVPSRRFAAFLTDRIGNFEELEPYLEHFRRYPVPEGVFEILVVEHDGESLDVPRIPKGSDGNASPKS